jgi:ornithine cyclodeaminase
VLLGKIEGRRNDAEITIFKSLGLAVEDLAVASYVGERARERGVGVEIDLEGRRDAGSR